MTDYWKHVGNGAITTESGKEVGQFFGDFRHRDRIIIAVNSQKKLLKDAARLELFELNSNLEIGTEDDDGDEIRVIYRVTGSRNDRQFEPIGRGRTLRDAIDDASRNLTHTVA